MNRLLLGGSRRLRKNPWGFFQYTGTADQKSVLDTNHAGHTFADCLNASQFEGGWIVSINHSSLEVTQGTLAASVLSFINTELGYAADGSLWWDGKPKFVGFRIYFGQNSPSWATSGVPIMTMVGGDVPNSTALTGSGTFVKTAGLKALVGTGSAFTTECPTTTGIVIGGEYRIVDVVTDNTHLTVTANWGNTGSSQAGELAAAYDIPLIWDATYQSRIRNTMTLLAARYDGHPRVGPVQNSLYGSRQAEEIIDMDAARKDGLNLSLCTPHDYTLWAPNGVAADVYTNALHAQLMYDCTVHMLRVWRKTLVKSMNNRMGFNTDTRNIFGTDGSPPATPHPSEDVTSRYLDKLMTIKEHARSPVGWSELDNSVGRGQHLIDEIMYSSAQYKLGTIWDWGSATPDTDQGYADAWAACNILNPRAFVIGPGDNNSAAKHTRFTTMSRNQFNRRTRY